MKKKILVRFYHIYEGGEVRTQNKRREIRGKLQFRKSLSCNEMKIEVVMYVQKNTGM